MTKNLIFIGGHPRSGTALMQGLCCRHTRTISVTREASYFRSLINAYRFGLNFFDRHTIDFFDNRKQFTKFHSELIEPYFQHVQSRFGTSDQDHIVLKEPFMTDYFPEIIDLFPRAKFLVMVRDLRDVIASQYIRATKKSRNYKLENDINHFTNTLYNLIIHKNNLNNSLLFVRYEGLVNSPTTVMRDIWKFLELENFNINKNTMWVAKRSSIATSSELDGKPPSIGHINYYKKILNEDMIQEINHARKFILSKTEFDPFFTYQKGDSEKSTFYINDIIRNRKY